MSKSGIDFASNFMLAMTAKEKRQVSLEEEKNIKNSNGLR